MTEEVRQEVQTHEKPGGEQKDICELRFSATLSKGGPVIPFAVRLSDNPPGVMIVPEKCIPVLVRAQELATYAGMIHDKYVRQSQNHSPQGQKEE